MEPTEGKHVSRTVSGGGDHVQREAEMKDIARTLIQYIAEQGWLGRIVPIDHLSEIEERIVGRGLRALIDDEFYRERLTGFAFEAFPELQDPRSIIIVAVPVPQVLAVFHWEGDRFPAILPPTYAGYRTTSEHVRATVAAYLRKAGYALAIANLPLKTLAVYSGLAEYGRNNISYVPGMGSFIQLVGAFSNLPSPDDPWGSARMMQRCRACKACLRACPTGAIAEDRFLLHAERCITFHNERSAAFPAWIDPAWHACLLGCMRCQSVCPENKAVLSWVEEKAEFTEEETHLLLSGAPHNSLLAGMAESLRRLDILDDLPVLARNLSILLAGKRGPDQGHTAQARATSPMG
jgi:epoxyqueuosine reductase